MQATSEQCAVELLEIIPLLMRTIRANMRSQRGPGMSVPQFRALAFIGRNQDATLSDVAVHLGLTLSAVSKLVDGLVSARLATRDIAAGDRRHVALALTVAGRKRHDAARSFTRTFLSEKLAGLDGETRRCLVHVARVLKETFGDEAPKKAVSANSANRVAKAPKMRRASKK